MLTTEHLLLRAYQSSDDANILELYDTPAVQLTMTNHLNTPLGTDFIEAVFRPSTKSAYFHSIITLRSDPSVFVGVVFLEHFDNAKDRSAMYSLAVLQAHQGKGYGTEVTKVVVDWGFRMGGLHRMWLSASECNLGAIRVYEKAGFQKDWVARQENWANGRWWDCIYMSLLEEEFSAMDREQTASMV